MAGKVVNGVDVGAVEGTVEAIKGDPGAAKFRFRLHNKWIDGGHNRSTVGGFFGAKRENPHARTFDLDADEPQVLAGTDLGANPVEHLLNALAACLTTTLVYHAAVRGIRIEELESDLEGDMDLRGSLGLSNEVRRGYQDIRVDFKVRADAGDMEKLKALSKLSPVFDVTSNGTRVGVSMERK
ncbi:MAG: OsmC family protein [Thermodesulfovibrionales bacterium]